MSSRRVKSSFRPKLTDSQSNGQKIDRHIDKGMIDEQTIYSLLCIYICALYTNFTFHIQKNREVTIQKNNIKLFQKPETMAKLIHICFLLIFCFHYVKFNYQN